MPVYFIRAGEDGPVKIGHGAHPKKRLSALQSGTAAPLRIVRTVPGGRPEEAGFHRRYQDRRISGEWFRWCDSMLTAEPVPAPELCTPLHEAVAFLGGQVATATVTGRAQASVWEWLKMGRAPIEACMLIELATVGRFTVEQMRPDLADTFANYFAHRLAPPQALREAA